MGTIAPAVGTTAIGEAVEAAPGPTIGGMPLTSEGVPKDVLEESEEDSEMASELVPEEVPVEGKMIIAPAAAPFPPHGALAASSSAPHAVAAAGRCSRCCGGTGGDHGVPHLLYAR
jgi:hypothetical protein